MKLIHCADIHLGSKIEAKFPKDKSVERRREILNTFERMVDYARENNIKVILLSGDVFDKDKPSIKDKTYFYKVIKNNKDIDFIYLNGNHDKDGSYVEDDIENLKTFNKNNFTYYNYGNICISGIEIDSINYKSFYSKLNLDKNKINIVLLHGEISDSFASNKIKLDQLKNKGIDYLALGHIHSFKEGEIDERGFYCYPGCLEGRGFDECGEKGFIELNINNFIEYKFVCFAKRFLIEKNIDISNAKDLFDINLKVKEKVKEIAKKNILRINLIGEIPYYCEFNEEDIKLALNDFYYVDIKNHTTTKIDISSYKDDKSLIGEFVKGVYYNNEYSLEEKNKIIALGLKLINGKEID